MSDRLFAKIAQKANKSSTEIHNEWKTIAKATGNNYKLATATLKRKYGITESMVAGDVAVPNVPMGKACECGKDCGKEDCEEACKCKVVAESKSSIAFPSSEEANKMAAKKRLQFIYDYITYLNKP